MRKEVTNRARETGRNRFRAFSKRAKSRRVTADQFLGKEAPSRVSIAYRARRMTSAFARNRRFDDQPDARFDACTESHLDRTRARPVYVV